MINQIPAHTKLYKAHNNSIESIAAHPSHQHFASGSHDKTIKIWDVGKFKESATYTDHKYNFILYLEKEFGRLTIRMMEKCWFREVLIKLSLFGIPKSHLQDKSSLAIKTKYTVLK